KFEIVIYPSDADPGNYGSETLWMAKDVGFVKGKTDGNAYGYIFTGKGMTRQLLSYNIYKSLELTTDQKAIKDIYSKAEGFIADERLDDLMGLYSDSYISECVDKEALHNSWQNIFDAHNDISFFMSPGEMLINDGRAQVTIELLATGVHQDSGQRWWNWERYADFFIKENGTWENYGDQLDFSPAWANVFVGKDSDSEYLVIDMDIADCDGEYITSPDNIASLTITGPPGTSIDSDLKKSWLDDGSWRGFRKVEDVVNGTNGFYTFTLEDVNGNKWFFTDYLNLDLAQPLRAPELISPDDGAVDISPGEVTLTWNPVDDGDYSWVDFINIIEARNESANQVVVTCPASTTCSWRVLARRFDIYGPWNGDYDYESTSNWRSFSTSAQ
ncbi:MAG: nuclear transport factor 2 family protein, partial [Thermodesulfobacteriota bacterium]|nr:nuclear transport factor 2 family protein [Thermodesulfobacteriota bacterium]